MTGKSVEVVDELIMRRVMVCCLQEKRWKGAGTRMLKGSRGVRYKFMWQGGIDGFHGVGVMVAEELVENVVAVLRVSERLMMVKLVIGKCLVNVVSAYAPQIGRSQEEELFWSDLFDLVRGLKQEEMIVIGGDLNGHVGNESGGYRGVHGGFGYPNEMLKGEAF